MFCIIFVLTSNQIHKELFAVECSQFLLRCKRRCDHKTALSGLVNEDEVKATVTMNDSLESSFNVYNINTSI